MATREELKASFEVYQEKRDEKEAWEKGVVKKNTSRLLFWLINKTRWKVWAWITGIIIESVPSVESIIVVVTKHGRLLDEKLFIFDDFDELIKRKVIENKSKERRN